MVLAKRKEREQAQLDALSRMVHGDSERRTCAYCGRSVHVVPASPLVRRVGLDGHPLSYGVCPDCEHLHAGASAAVVIAERLDLDPAAELLGFVTLPRFADQPGALPQRPNSEPWGHLSDRELAELVADARREVTAVSTTPCRFCGDARRTEGHGRTSDGLCPSCDWHVGHDRYFDADDGRRDYCAAWLAGIDTTVRPPPRGFGAEVDLRFFHELPPEQQRGAWRCFDWHDTAELVAWRRELGLDQPPALPVPPPAPRLVGRAVVTVRTKQPVRTEPPDPARLVEARRAKW